MAGNPFDQFDAPAGPNGPATSTNPFDQFDAPAPDHGPGLLAKIGHGLSVAGRSVLQGLTASGSTMQGAGTAASILGSDAQIPVNADDGDKIADDVGLAKPTSALGKIASRGIKGATEAVANPFGAAQSLPMTVASGALGEAGSEVAKDAGAPAWAQTATGIAAGLTPAGGAAARTGAANAVKGAMSSIAAKGMTTDDAVQTAILNDAIKQYQAAAPGKVDGLTAASSYKKDLNSAIGAYRPLASKAGYIDAPGSNALQTATQQANSHTSTLTGVPGSSLDVVQGLNLPGYHQDAVENGLNQLNTVSGQQFKGNSAGPLSTLGKGVGNLVSAIPFADKLGGKIVGPAAARLGQIGDTVLGTQMTPAQAQHLAAQKALQKVGIPYPKQDTLGDLRGAISDAQGDIRDQQLNAKDTTADTSTGKQTDKAWAANDAAKAAQEAIWDKALAQRDKQTAVDPLSNALWKDAEQQNNQAPNLNAVTNSQVKGFNADQGSLAKRDASEQAAEDAMKARGLNMSESAGNWMERQQIKGFKKDNPDVPVTGAASLSAQSPQDVFAATGGKYGSPAAPVDPRISQPQGSPPPAPQGPPQAPPAAPMPAPATPVAATPAMPPSGLGASPLAPAGGKALVSMIHQGAYPQHPALQTHEIDSAINDMAADGTVHPLWADAALSGVNLSRNDAAHVAERAQQLRSTSDQAVSDVQTAMGQAQPGSQPSQAVSDVKQAMGQSPTGAIPNGGDKGPIQNLYRYNGKISSVDAHLAQMKMLAKSDAERQALDTARHTSSQSVADATKAQFAAENPGADLSRFTSIIMKKVNP